MIRARLSNGGFLFGLDAENVRRLKAGKPIKVDMTQLGGTDKFVLVYGETMADIVRELEEQTGQKLPPATPFFDSEEKH